MDSATYRLRRGQIETYFDRVASDAWARLTSDAPVSGIRATVRRGRDAMRATLLEWLPQDLRGRRILDAGCGTGAFAVAAAMRGAHVTAIDLSPTLVQLARERLPQRLGAGEINFTVGDMLDPALGRFDHVIGMDSLIHYRAEDTVAALSQLAPRVERSILFTFAPRTPLLATMHAVGRIFPRGDRAPSIEPVSERSLLRRIEAAPALAMFEPGRTKRISSGFYISQALEVLRT
jgi:magnesium-protoporphyrin O-methyltransferase